MQVNPERETFSDIMPTDELNAKLAEGSESLDDVIVQGELDQLRKLQDDLRKAGYRKQFK